ncbi:hypothetical protein HPY31_13690 [Brevibacillus sp. HB1.3]|uniref:hypothetical protein n=1 Tax=Brevibacillus sp. HB1.3 TaxID=2738842 RepID=UPI001556A189|nr:hypothetical protein [Brevibacillus sp. HB1.3]
MAIGQMTRVSLPSPSTWEIQASFGGRPTTLGTLVISNVSNGRVSGTVNFRGTPTPIQGSWDERSRQITIESPYANFVGTLAYKEEPTNGLRHYVLRGTVRMKPPSVRAGEVGTWTAVTHLPL